MGDIRIPRRRIWQIGTRVGIATSSTVLRKRSAYALLIIIVCAAFLLRFAAYDHPLGHNGGDGYDDYLVASHALTYGEWPILGPSNDFLPGMRNSPLYYYFIILFASIWNSPQFLYLSHIFLQCGTIACAFFITNKLFGNAPALISAALIAFAPAMISQESTFLWQPYVMQPVLLFSVLLLVWGFEASSLKLLSASLVCMIAALALHLSVLGILPVYFSVAAFVAYNIGGYRALAKGVLVGFVTFLLLFLIPITHPVQQHYWRTLLVRSNISHDLSHNLSQVQISHLSTEIRNAAYALTYQFAFIGTSKSWHLSEIDHVELFLALIALYFFVSNAPRSQKYAAALLICALTSQILAVAVIGAGNQIWELIPAICIIPILLAISLWEIARRIPGTPLILLFFLIAYAYLAINDPRLQTLTRNIPTFARPRQVVMDQAVQAMSSDIESLKTTRAYADYHFFNVVAYRQGDHLVRPAVFWQPLERTLGVPFTKVDNQNGYALTSINSDEYIFLACMRGEDVPYSIESCTEQFKREHSSYTIVKTTYDDPVLTVYLTRKNMSAQ